MFNGTGLGAGRGRVGKESSGFSSHLHSILYMYKVFLNDGHPIYYLLSLFDEQCSCEWLVQFICQTVNSFHHIGVICNGKCML